MTSLDVPGLQTGRPLIAFDLLCRVLRDKAEGRNFAAGDAARQNTRIVLPRGSVPVSRFGDEDSWPSVVFLGLAADEGHPEALEEGAGGLVVLGRGDDGDVHPLLGGAVAREVDLGEDRLLLEAERAVAAAVEAARRPPNPASSFSFCNFRFAVSGKFTL